MIGGLWGLYIYIYSGVLGLCVLELLKKMLRVA